MAEKKGTFWLYCNQNFYSRHNNDHFVSVQEPARIGSSWESNDIDICASQVKKLFGRVLERDELIKFSYKFEDSYIYDEEGTD